MKYSRILLLSILSACLIGCGAESSASASVSPAEEILEVSPSPAASATAAATEQSAETPTAAVIPDNDAVIFTVNEDAINSTYVSMDVNEQRFPEYMTASVEKEADGYVYFKVTDTRDSDSVVFGVMKELKDLELQIAGANDPDDPSKPVVFISLKFPQSLVYESQNGTSKYGINTYDRNFGSIDGMDYQTFWIGKQDAGTGKGFTPVGEQGDWRMTMNDGYYEFVNSSADVSAQEKDELKELHSMSYIILPSQP
ncbi:hypothetical protein [Anaerolactibacter massiliensis]|uniref:hypothetical protein n=1 Tax=Anaerolactibacter massiliensis TaxID=2044573 RepID=UPI00107F5150|nr:hypothetical protein [Anaerolactibacter massiliensis]